MIKKFEVYSDPLNPFRQYLVEAFVDFLDDGGEINERDTIEIFIKIPEIFKKYGALSMDFNYDELKSYIDLSKKHTDILEDIDVAIKRVYEEFKIMPKLYHYEEDGYDDGFYGIVVEYEII